MGTGLSVNARQLAPRDFAHEPAAPAHLAFARALEANGRAADAAAAYQAAERSDEASIEARLGLARIYLLLGRVDDAFAAADAALAVDPRNAGAWAIVADAHSALGDAEHAVRAGARAVELAPHAADLRVRFGQISELAERPFDAAAAYRRALALGPSARAECEALVALSGLHGRAGQFARARRHAEAALRADPTHQGAHQNLAAICEHEGDADAAKRHREIAYRGRALIASRALRPRRRVLTLASGERANAPDRHLIPATRYDRLIWFLAYDDGVPDQECDVVFNAIADADAAHAMRDRLAAVCGQLRPPLLNPPERVARTARDGAEHLFQGVAGLVVPSVRRVATPADLAHLDAGGDWLLRPVGAHGGEQLDRVTLADAARKLDGRPHYLTAFHDYRSTDGLFRKYRIFFVDRAPYPYHLAIGEGWLQHYQTSRTPHEAAFLDEELQFLEAPSYVLGEVAYAAICEIGRRLDLDFAGVDFAVLPDGRALLFEANATMLAHDEACDGALAFKRPFVRRILEAFWERLESVRSIVEERELDLVASFEADSLRLPGVEFEHPGHGIA